MNKQIKDLMPGDTFKDSFGNALKVEKLGELKTLPTGREVIRVYMVTENANRMYMSYPANRVVELVK